MQNRVSTFWFKGKELALAFGFTLSFSRLVCSLHPNTSSLLYFFVFFQLQGSVLNFLVTDRYAQWLWPGDIRTQVVNTLWSGSLSCIFVFCSVRFVMCDGVQDLCFAD